ncbi:hypothetical protein LPB142_04405 [Rhodobacter xanthinilyticus]|uniref:OmpA-like domain-containing protein n=1 Tax=Rhodobacter xanthinilyticus TaxID=1850250 RepID=A0A1D9MA32_9RHOB|nr:OmpA family protein [Rhodobacter xanthinilyticus]AOZ68650.1 hypothetical protein LPB142_04405 [Rhodobacter xanthinilyticus]
MKRFKTTTALVAGLATLAPSFAPAQGLATAACITQKTAAGASPEEARAACMGGGGAGGGAAETGRAKAPAASEAAPAPEAAPEAQPESPARKVKEPKPAKTAPEAAPTLAPEAAPAAGAEPTVESAPAPEAAPAQAPAAEEPKPKKKPKAEPAAEPVTAAPTAPEAPAATAEPAPEAAPAPQTDVEALRARLGGGEAAPAPTRSPAEAESVQQLETAIEAAGAAETGAPVANAALEAGTEAGAEAPAGATVTEEVITEETARSSGEDFGSTIATTAAPAVPAPQPTAKTKDKGLSDVEKLAILGLGALAVGTLLTNGSEVAANSGDRIVVQNPDGTYQVIKDDNALLRQPGSTMSTQTFPDGSSRTVSTKADGTQIITVYDAQRRIVQRTRIDPDGRRYVLIDDAQGAAPVQVSTLPRASLVAESTDAEALAAALARESGADRRFTLAQVRQIAQVRALAPAVAVENVTFATGSAAIAPEQARRLAALGDTIRAEIARNPREIFLIEGHTDAVGDAAYNLALSDRRAESLALALSEYFAVPAENLVVQGYGEQFLKVDTQGASEANRRVSVRRITDLLQTASAQ